MTTMRFLTESIALPTSEQLARHKNFQIFSQPGREARVVPYLHRHFFGCGNPTRKNHSQTEGHGRRFATTNPQPAAPMATQHIIPMMFRNCDHPIGSETQETIGVFHPRHAVSPAAAAGRSACSRANAARTANAGVANSGEA